MTLANLLSIKTAWLLIVALNMAACAGLPARGQVGGRIISTRVDSEVARYYLANYLSGQRADLALDARIDGVYRNATGKLPDRDELKRISDAFSVDFAALYMADRILGAPENREFRLAYERNWRRARAALGGGGVPPAAPADYEVMLVPGFLYQRYPVTGANLAAPRAALKKFGWAHFFVETVEDGTIEANAEIVMAAIRARASGGRRLIVVSVSKSGPEVALALTQLAPAETRAVAAWVNVAGTIQGSPLADDRSFQLENYTGNIDMVGVESLSTPRSRRRFAGFRVPEQLLLVNYIGVPVVGSVSMLARPGFYHLRSFGPNDGLVLLPDLIVPGGVTLAEVGPDHFLLDEDVEATTAAMLATVIEQLARPTARAPIPVGRAMSE